MEEKVYPPSRHRERWNRPGDGRYLTCSCFRNQKFLKGELACTWFVEALARAREKHGPDLWAWCVMPTHFHVLVLPRREDPTVSGFLKSLKQSVTNRAVAWVEVNAPAFLARMTDRQPSGKESRRFWQRNGGYDRNMITARRIWDVIHYIHNNPVEEGLVRRAAEWPWSSAREYEKRGSGPLSIDFGSIPRLRAVDS